MQSLSPEPKELEDLSCGGVLLLAGFLAVMVFNFTAIYLPGLLQPQVYLAVLWLGGIALVAAIFSVLIHRLHFNFLSNLVLFILVQWIGLWGRIWMRTQIPPPLFFNPLAIIKDHIPWIAAGTVLWMAVLYYGAIFQKLSRIPKRFESRDRAGARSITGGGEEYKADLTPWEKNWRSWRFAMLLLMLVTVLGFAVGFPARTTNYPPGNLLAGLLLLQFISGFILIALGYYFYRRAFWTAGRLEPGPGIKRVWQRGLAVFLVGAAGSGLIMPADFRHLDKWWLYDILHWLLGFIDRTPSVKENRIRQFNLEAVQGIFQNSEPGLLWKILGIIFIIPVLLLLVLAFTAMVVICIGYLFSLMRSFPGELEKIKKIPGFFIKVYLYWVKLWRRHRPFPAFWPWKRRHDPVDKLKRPKRKKGPGHWWGLGPQAIIRRGYYRLVESARSKGLHLRPAQTPEEIAAGLAGLLPGTEDALAEITTGYQQARYSSKVPLPEKVRRFEQLRQTLQRRLKR